MHIGNIERLLARVTRLERESPVLAEIEVVSQAHAILEAVRLVQLGARAALVSQLTGISKPVVSDLYRPLTGAASPPGQVPFTDTWYLRNTQRMMHANLVWQLYHKLEQIGRSAASVLIHVYEAYLAITDKPLLTLTRAFFVPRLVSIQAWYPQSCDHCTKSFIGPLASEGSICPVCIDYFHHRCRHCGIAITCRPSGRWKTACAACQVQQHRHNDIGDGP